MSSRPEGRRAVRQSAWVVAGGQLERALGTFTALAIRWGLEPEKIGIYTGLRMYLDNTNRTSLGVSLGAAQRYPVLRAEGREAEAARLADVAFTTNTATSSLYALGLLVWVAWRYGPNGGGWADPYAREWMWGLIAMAALAPLKRYRDFLVVILRSRQEFELTTRLEVLDAGLFAALAGTGIAALGFAGLPLAVGLLMAFDVVYLRRASEARGALDFRFAWDWGAFKDLWWTGLPIWVNTVLLTMVECADRTIILWGLEEPERAAGLYTIAIMGTSWAADLAGRVVSVMYTYFQTTLGRTRDPGLVGEQASRATEAQAPLLFAGSAVAYVAGPSFLGFLMPRYAEGVSAMRPLLPGMLLLGLSLGARQMLITVGRGWSAGWATALSLGATVGSGLFFAKGLGMGIEGVSWGMTLGYATLFAGVTLAAHVPTAGLGGWAGHVWRLFRGAAWYGAGAFLAAHGPWVPGGWPWWGDLGLRLGLLGAWMGPALWIWGRGHGWGGLLERGGGFRGGGA